LHFFPPVDWDMVHVEHLFSVYANATTILYQFIISLYYTWTTLTESGGGYFSLILFFLVGLDGESISVRIISFGLVVENNVRLVIF
jgi:hypothetical protein